MKKILVFTFFYILTFNATAQNYYVDSLKSIVKKNENDTTVIKNYLKLYEEFEYSNTDTAIFYCQQALALSLKIDNKKYEAYSLYYIGGLYDTQGIYELAFKNYSDALELFEQQNDIKGIGGCFNCIGIVLWEQSEQATSAVKQYKLTKAIEYIDKGLKHYITINYKMGIGVCFMNNGIVYNDYAKIAKDNKTKIHRFNYAMDNYKNALKVFEDINDERSVSDCNLNIALLYYDIYLNKKNSPLTKKEYEIIKGYLEKAKKQYIECNDLYGESMVLKNLATIKINYSKTIENNQALLHDAVKNAKKSLIYADSLDALFLKYDAYYSLCHAYKGLKNFKLALKYHELYSAGKDSVFNEKKSKAIEEIQTQYETEKKNVEIKELTIKNIKNITFSIAGLLLFVSLIMIFFFRQKNKTNKILNSKNNELKQLNSTQNRLMSIISHDFKAPLSAFYSITNSLKTKFDKIERSEIDNYLNRMLNSSVALKLQLENMLNWAINQSRKINVNLSNFNLYIIVYKTVMILQEFANEKSIVIENKIEKNFELKTDGRLLSIVLNNLISNAVKYSDSESEIIISAKTNNNKTIISVKDFGKGMSKENADNLFTNKPIDTNHENSGTGLGLIVSKDIIEKLNGKIWAKSELNKGTKIFIEL